MGTTEKILSDLYGYWQKVISMLLFFCCCRPGKAVVKVAAKKFKPSNKMVQDILLWQQQPEG
ncbi:hypothetical protein [Botryobacter ruber]|uniref:hypothetical protein n=1 Tax=Botryobacter ruber TaxID=2171629 RepID=UPI000F64E8BE|nr:hypothetical protein [Botryobacter ruber]